MQKKRIYILLTITIVVLGIGLIAPYLIGMKTKAHLENFLSLENKKDAGIKVILKNYNRGIYISNVQVELQYVSPLSPLKVPLGIINNTILHGPIIVDFKEKSMCGALAKIKSSIQLINSIWIEFDQRNLSTTSFIGYMGKPEIECLLNKISGLLHLSTHEHATASTDYEFDLNNIKMTVTEANLASFIEDARFRNVGLDTEMHIKNIKLQNGMRMHSKTNINYSNLALAFDDLELQSANHKLNLKAFDSHMLSQLENHHKQFNWDSTFRRVEYKGNIYGPFQLSFVATNFPGDLFNKIMPIFQTEKSWEQKFADLKNEIQYHDLNANFNLNILSLRLPGGELDITGKTQVVSKLKENVRNYHDSIAKYNIKISKRALDENLMNLIGTLNKDPNSSVYGAQLLNFIKQTGMIIDNGNRYESYIVYKNNRVFLNGSHGVGLLSKKMNCEFKQPLDTEQQLLLAIWFDDAERVKALLQKGIKADYDYKEIKHPLPEAALLGDKEIINLLLKHGFQVNQSDYDGNTALYWACRLGYHDIVQELLNRGANPNTVNNAGWTPLQEASENGFKSIVELLIAKNVDINRVDSDGRSALFWAATNNQSDIIQLLKSKGADLNLKNIRGKTALDIAKERNHSEAVKALEKS